MIQATGKSGKGQMQIRTTKNLPLGRVVQLLSFLPNAKVRLIEMLLFLWYNELQGSGKLPVKNTA